MEDIAKQMENKYQSWTQRIGMVPYSKIHVVKVKGWIEKVKFWKKKSR